MEKSNEDRAAEKTSKKEQAINIGETQGKEINHQIKDKKEIHQPRDNA